MSALKNQLKQDMIAAMKSGEKTKLGTIRLINAAIKQHEVDKREDVTDELVINILNKLRKQRLDSIAQFQSANRQDLAEIEKNEVEIINDYLPVLMTDEEIVAVITQVIVELKPNGMADMGKVMGVVKVKVGSLADMSVVSRLVKNSLI